MFEHVPVVEHVQLHDVLLDQLVCRDGSRLALAEGLDFLDGAMVRDQVHYFATQVDFFLSADRGRYFVSVGSLLYLKLAFQFLTQNRIITDFLFCLLREQLFRDI